MSLVRRISDAFDNKRNTGDRYEIRQNPENPNEFDFLMNQDPDPILEGMSEAEMEAIADLFVDVLHDLKERR